MPRTAKGFTLVELLVVISIIAILAVIGMTVFGSVLKSARDTKRIADLDSISKALTLYYSANQSYPDVSCGTIPSSMASLNSYFTSGVAPDDPNPSAFPSPNSPYNYTYCPCTSSSPPPQYLICTRLENPTGKTNHRIGNGSACDSSWHFSPDPANNAYCIHSSL